MHRLKLFILCQVMLLVYASSAEKDESPDKDKWKMKKLQDYNDADIERLYDQWEEGDEDELEEDELPEYKRTPPKIDMSQLDMSDPENVLKMSKKGRTLMMFVSISGDPSEKETERISQLWQTSLFNANYETQRYVVGSNRILFMIKDGSKAYEIRDFLVQQDRCAEVTIENQNYPGKGAKKENESSKKDKTSAPKKQRSANDIKKEEL